jgi:hypothetical protein
MTKKNESRKEQADRSCNPAQPETIYAEPTQLQAPVTHPRRNAPNTGVQRIAIDRR